MWSVLKGVLTLSIGIKFMSHKANDEYLERMAELEEEVRDYEKALEQDTQALENAQRWVDQSSKNLVQAKLLLEKYKNLDY